MKKAAIITIYDMNNYGNRLQNYATQEILKKQNLAVETIINANKNFHFSYYLKHIIKLVLKKRYYNFCKFNKNINFSKTKVNFTNISPKLSNYDYYVVGSDQVWNPNFQRLNDLDLITFTNSKNKIALSASFGTKELPQKYQEKVIQNLIKFRAISLREESGKQIVSKLTNRKDVEVLIDPTMLLTIKEWNEVAKKPKHLPYQKYILVYFLGDITKEYYQEINRIAKENNYEIINLLDKKSSYYKCGPSEFLYLHENASLICTDSFHSCIFSILYNRSFIIFDRVQEKMQNMNTRIITLLNTFKLTDRKFVSKIKKEQLTHDYTQAYKILEQERQKVNQFLKRALDKIE